MTTHLSLIALITYATGCVEPSKIVKCMYLSIDERMLLDNHLRFTTKKAYY